VATGDEPERDFWLPRLLRTLGRWWYVIGPGGLLVLGAGACLLRQLAPAAADVASILSLLIGLPGFVLTIWAVLETQRIERESKKELQRQLEASRRETREALGKVKTALYLTDCREAYGLANNARDAIRARLWGQARQNCEGMRRACGYIVHSGLAVTEVEKLKEALDKLPPVLATLSEYESEKPKVADLAGKQGQWEPLEGIRFVLETIDARNRAQVLEAPHGGEPTS
jgi:hypothetical protein